ncbi:HK97 family phage prohead protease [Sinorhizobium medicae]|nr:HK97 family phage prohead protease [Sinorhizobium medicae]
MQSQKFDPVSLRFTTPDLDAKAGADGVIEGYASVFGPPPDRQGDIVEPGAFARCLREIKAEGVALPMLWAHKQERPIGRWTSLVEDRRGLAVKGFLNINTRDGAEAFEHIRGGSATALSIGFLIPEGGRKYRGDGAFSLLDIDLAEISVVPCPANRRAKIEMVKSISSRAELIDALHESGLPKRAAIKVANGGWPALSGAETEEKAKCLLAAITGATERLKGK